MSETLSPVEFKIAHKKFVSTANAQNILEMTFMNLIIRSWETYLLSRTTWIVCAISVAGSKN